MESESQTHMEDYMKFSGLAPQMYLAINFYVEDLKY
jgi:hypothetical protein